MDKEASVKATAEYEAASAWKPTPTARKIISFVERHAGKPCSKAQIAVALGRNEKTIDRLIARMRHEGILDAEPLWAENGGQLANTYHVVHKQPYTGLGGAEEAEPPPRPFCR